MNLQVCACLNEKFKVMSVDLHQRGTRPRSDFQVHLFPTMIKVSFGGDWVSFIPCPAKIRPTSLIASDRDRLR